MFMYLMVVLPVLVLAEGAAVTRSVAPRAGLLRLATAVPAALWKESLQSFVYGANDKRS